MHGLRGFGLGLEISVFEFMPFNMFSWVVCPKPPRGLGSKVTKSTRTEYGKPSQGFLEFEALGSYEAGVSEVSGETSAIVFF